MNFVVHFGQAIIIIFRAKASHSVSERVRETEAKTKKAEMKYIMGFYKFSFLIITCINNNNYN